MKITSKYRTIASLYKHFAKDWQHMFDFSEQSLIEMYCQETFGDKIVTKNNGYELGKKWMGVNIAMWKEDIAKGYLFKFELYQDPTYPHWWLDKVLK